MIAGLAMMGWVLAAEVAVPTSQDPLAWARAWAEVVQALQDESLADTRIEWAPEDDGWALSLQYGGQTARVSGLVPATTHSGRLEQLYVAVSLLGRGRQGSGLDSLIDAPPPTPPAKPQPPRAPPPPGPQAEAGAAPPPSETWVAARPTTTVSLVDVPMAVDDDRSSLVASLMAIPGDGVVGLSGAAAQVTWQPVRIGLGVRVMGVYRRDLVPVSGAELGGRLEELRFDLMPLAVARLWSQRWWTLTVAAGVGPSVRQLTYPARTIQAAPMAVGHAQIGFEAGGTGRLRAELVVTRDVQPIVVQFDPGPSGEPREVDLPGTRVMLGVGYAIGGRR